MSARPTRRAVLLAGAAMAIASRAAAEEAPTRRIFFIAGAGARSGPNIATFEDELRQLGYSDGRNIAIDYLLRSVDLTPEALTEAITAQIARGAQVIIAYGPERTLKAAVAATRSGKSSSHPPQPSPFGRLGPVSICSPEYNPIREFSHRCHSCSFLFLFSPLSTSS